MLLPLILLPLISIFSIIFISTSLKQILYISLSISILTLFHSYLLILLFDHSLFNLYQFNELNGIMGIDGISLWLIWLVNLLIPIVLLSTLHTNTSNYKLFYILLISIGFWSNCLFLILDLFGFYISFEGVLIPMYLFINLYGSRNRKLLASHSFFLFTLAGSLLLFLSIIYLYLLIGSTHNSVLFSYQFNYNNVILYFIWLSLFIAFAIKVPIIPFHIWLPEAHVESPTSGSVLLAGILLKLGSFGFIRYSIPLFPICTLYYTPLIYSICTLGIIYCLFSSLSLWDIKKIIAYSSIAHMNLALISLFSNHSFGLIGGIFFLISHGLISSGLFLLIGVLYDRYHTRTILYYRGLVLFMPLFSYFFLFFTLSNIALPGTSAFISEILCFIGLFQSNPLIAFICSFSIVLTPIFSLWLLHKLCYGQLSTYLLVLYSDLSLKEFHTLLPLLIWILILGFFPNLLLNFISPISSLNLIN